jgi:hypothetical protein
MASLADLVLGAGDPSELEVDDDDLIRELEELQKLRAETSSSSSSRPVTANIVSDHGRKDSGEGATCREPSLADKILSRSDGVDNMDREFEAMEQELQNQLLRYKEQCQGSDLAAPVEAAVVNHGQDASTTAGSTSWPSRPSSKASASGKDQPLDQPLASRANDDEPASEMITPELVGLRAEAAQLEEVFPDADGANDTVAADKPIRHRRVRRAGYPSEREAAPQDREIADMKEMLAGLDVRMSAIQQRHALHDPFEHAAAAGLNSAAAKAITEMRAQNNHLRERFEATGKRGLLRLDPSLFGVAEKPTKGSMSAAEGARHVEPDQASALSSI